MNTTSVAQPAPPAPREGRSLRGLALYRDYADEIETIGKGVYAVPGCSGGSYTVNLAVFGDDPESCDCPDRAPVCKHLVAATIFRAKVRMAARRVHRLRRRRPVPHAATSRLSRWPCEGSQQGSAGISAGMGSMGGHPSHRDRGPDRYAVRDADLAGNAVRQRRRDVDHERDGGGA